MYPGLSHLVLCKDKKARLGVLFFCINNAD
jgi:hypothetical protein